MSNIISKIDWSRREFIVKAGTAGASLAGACSAKGLLKNTPNSGSERPNIIFLLTDDQRWDALGCMGNPIIKTPNLDRLGNEGVVFLNNFVTTSICMASRATYFTGLYESCHGIVKFSLPLSEDAFAQSYPALMRAAGYRMGFVGKWGLGGELPEDDFDFFFGFPGQGRYFHEIGDKRVHLTQILGDKSLEFLRGCSATEPFCLSVSFKAPHVQDAHPKQFLYDPNLEDLYEDATVPVPETADDRFFDALPDFLKESEGRRRWEMRFTSPEHYQESVKGYYRLITGVDIAVGRIVGELERLKLSDNTIFVFTGDNGFYLGEHGLAGKWFMHEESIRTPLLIYDPRQPALARGQRREEMVLNVDVHPTLLDLAGIDIPPFVQGRSLVPLVQGELPEWRKEWFYEHSFSHASIPPSEGIRTERWKYIRYTKSDPLYEELYDLENDPHETRNLADDARHLSTVDGMRERWQVWRNSLVNWSRESPAQWREPG